MRIASSSQVSRCAGVAVSAASNCALFVPVQVASHWFSISSDGFSVSDTTRVSLQPEDLLELGNIFPIL